MEPDDTEYQMVGAERPPEDDGPQSLEQRTLHWWHRMEQDDAADSLCWDDGEPSEQTNEPPNWWALNG